MNWITNVLRPKLKNLFSKIKDVPENLWVSCPKCHALLYTNDIGQHLNVCPKCSYHLALPIEERFKSLFDGAAYKVIETPKTKPDPLDFRDLKKNKDRLAAARENSGREEAIEVAEGKIGGKPAVVAVMNFDFMGGSMGSFVGEAILAAASAAVKKKAALIIVTASGGARMQEGIVSLTQMARTTIAINMLRDAGLPYIVILTNPTYGGVSASFAMLGDVHIAEHGAMIGFAGRRVIEQTVKKKLPDDFQTAEFLKERGAVDIVIPRRDLADRLGLILQILMHKKV